MGRNYNSHTFGYKHPRNSTSASTEMCLDPVESFLFFPPNIGKRHFFFTVVELVDAESSLALNSSIGLDSGTP